jgi:hypothetical protein
MSITCDKLPRDVATPFETENTNICIKTLLTEVLGGLFQKTIVGTLLLVSCWPNTEKKFHKTLTPNPLKKVKVAGRQLVDGKLTEAVFVQKPGVAHRMYGKPNKRPMDGKQ